MNHELLVLDVEVRVQAGQHPAQTEQPGRIELALQIAMLLGMIARHPRHARLTDPAGVEQHVREHAFLELVVVGERAAQRLDLLEQRRDIGAPGIDAICERLAARDPVA